MFVKDLMVQDVATVTPDVSVSKAFQVLYERRHSQLPVIEDNKLVGLITEKLLSELSPSKATSLSVFEINYLLSKTKVKDVMLQKVYTVSPDAFIEEAALIMYEKDIGSLPVVDADNHLVGILTRLDIFKVFIAMMGVNETGTRIVLKVTNEVGIIANITAIVRDLNINIQHVSNFTHGDQAEIILRVDTTDAEELVKKLEECGYTILGVNTDMKQ